VLTDSVNYCPFYKAQSQNVVGKGYCTSTNSTVANNPADCTAQGGTWSTQPAWGNFYSIYCNVLPGIPAPDCVTAPWLRGNNFGATMTGFLSSYNWTLPRSSQESCITNNNCNCVIRIRYNISSTDLNTGSLTDANNPETGFIDWKYNAASSPVTDTPSVTVDGNIYSLSLSSTQVPRTFEDRSYVFHIKPRSQGNVPDNAKVYNLNVRGKRGSTVQAFPAMQVISQGSQNAYIIFSMTTCRKFYMLRKEITYISNGLAAIQTLT
jgi:hypothetical protein